MEAIDLIRANAICRPFVYDGATGRPVVPGAVLCGHPMIGYGRALDVTGVFRGEIEQMLRNDLTQATRDAMLAVGMVAWMRLGAPRQAALIDLAHQSRDGLAKRRRLLEAVRAGEWQEACEDMLSGPDGARDPRVKRSAAILLNGEWPL